MAFQKGHTTNVKLHTPELKQEAFRQYCNHIAKGRPKKAWRLKKLGFTLTWETMEKYIKEDPDTFDPSHKKEAEADSLERWFTVLEEIATGDNPKGNVAATQVIMRNMHKWDAKDHRDDDDDTSAQLANERLLEQLSKLQKKEPEHS